MQTTNLLVAKYNDDQPRDDHGRWSSGGEGGSIELSPHDERVYEGQQKDVQTQMSKQEVGATGEKIAVSYLQSKGLSDAHPLNMHTTNFPVDLVGDHQLVEVKTGLVSNGRSAQQWRATIGEPGKSEKEWLKSASAEDKRKWNEGKQQAILNRKNAVLKQFSKQLGAKVKGLTMGIILNPDTKTADVHVMQGFHSRVGWNSDTAKSGYVGTFKYK